MLGLLVEVLFEVLFSNARFLLSSLLSPVGNPSRLESINILPSLGVLVVAGIGPPGVDGLSSNLDDVVYKKGETLLL